MGLKAKWTMVCDNCGLVVEKELRPEEDGIAFTDEWGPGVPDGWLQIPYDETTGKCYLFFHGDECYTAWLRSQGRTKELEEFEETMGIE